MLPPRLREQFLEDLKIMARLESPLPEDEAHLCPTVTAAMILAEYNISHDELGFAYDYIVQAASKGLLFARALASRLEPYKNSQMKEFTSGKFRMRLTSHRDVEQPDISNKISSWLYEAAALGSVSALEHLKPNKSKYTNALRTLRTCRVGGFQHLSMWTVLDATYSRQEGYLVAGPIGGDEITAKIILDKHDEDHCRWINAGPRIGSEISFLHVACAKGLREAVDVVLKRGAPVNSKFCPGDETPLLLACMSGSSETVKRLLKHGANPCMSDNDGETPLHWLSAFDADDIPTIAGLLYRRKAQLSASAKGSVMLSEGYFLELAFASGTPLHRAVGKRNIHAVRALLDLGADPLAVNDRQHTPFGLAAMFHLAEILKLLHSRVPNYKPNQDHGPDLRLFNFAINSASPLQQFNVHGVKWYDEMKNTLQTLLDFGESLYGYNGEDNFIRNAIAVGNLKMVEFLLANGASEHVNKFDYSGCGFPALYHALELGHQRIFTTLLNHGADVESLFVPEKMRQPGTKILLDNRPDRSTYLHVCAEMGADTWFVSEFLRRGVPINQQDANWQTALYLAIKAGYTGIATVLIEHGANLKEILDGKTILGQLATEGFGVSKDRFQFLLGKLPASPAAKLLTGPRDRQSIFHHFAQDGRVIRQPAWARELLQFFIDQIGDRRLLDLQDTAMNTALHLAVQHGNTEVARALLEAKANCNLRSNEGFTPLALANNLRAPGYKDVVALLQAHGAVAEKKEADTVDVNTAKALWMELGFPEKDDEWLDTALVHVLQQLQQDLLTLFREDGFLISENPWKSATKVVWDCVSTNTAIVEKKERIRDFEYATGQMLHGFVDVVSVKLQENDELLVKLVKPFNKRERKFPPGLLNPQITLSVRTPGVGMTSYFQSDSEAVALGIRPKKSEDPEQKPEKSSASPDKINDGMNHRSPI
jgi:ankyrin repeat protein